MRFEECEDIFVRLDIVGEPKNKGIILTAHTVIKGLQTWKYRSGMASLFALDEVWLDQPQVYSFKAFIFHISAFSTTQSTDF